MDPGLWTLDSALCMFCIENVKGRGGGWGLGDVVGTYRIYVFPLISTTFFLFLADFPSFFLFLYKQSDPGCFARAPPPPVNEGGMVEGIMSSLLVGC